ncbi:hypothetical protein NOVA_33110 [Nocardia nova]|uniref:hypothetical protein n=1 Tax=Nocardia nova TaxID=37330 RepID=UPI001C46CF68|nr:hypothetical protein [Nocardia nova]MBV7707634.1 hypothetical protein [Nocardia nova]
MQALKQAANGIGGDTVMPDSWTSPDKEILMSVRTSMGLGRKRFADRLNEVLGPVEWPLVPVNWQAVWAWETEVNPPRHVVDAALAILRGCRVVDLDAVEVFA